MATPAERKGGGAGLAVGVGLIGLGALGLGAWALTAKAAPSGKKKATVTLSVSSTSILKGESIDIDGELLDDQGKPLTGKVLYISIGGNLLTLGTTDGLGQVHATISFPLAGSFPTFLMFKGDATYDPASSSTATIIVSDPSTIIHFEDFKADPNERYFIEDVLFSGILLNGTTPIADAEIKIEHKDLIGRIAYSQKGITLSDGRFGILTNMPLCGIAPLDEIRNKAIYEGGGYSNFPFAPPGPILGPSSSVVSGEIRVKVHPTIAGFGFRAADGNAQPLQIFEGETLVGSRPVQKVYHSAYISGSLGGVDYKLEKVLSGGLLELYSKNYNNEKIFVETSVNDMVLGFKMRTVSLGFLVSMLVEPSIFEVRVPSAHHAHMTTPRGSIYGLKEIPINAMSVGTIMFCLVNKASSSIALKVGYKQVSGGATIPLYTETMIAGRRNSLQTVTSNQVINGVTHEGGTLRRVVVNDRVYSIVFESDVAGMSELELLAEWI